MRTISSLLLVLGLISTGKIYAQENSVVSPHNGFQIGLYTGGSFGDIKGKTTDGLNPVIRGSGMQFSLDIGFATSDWSVGLFSLMNSVSIKSIEVNDTAYAMQPGYTMDFNITGVYVTRYFMPINAYIRIKGGIGRFTTADAEFNELWSTDKGFGWSIMAGKDFLLGKKKRWGIGAFISLTGIKCHDLPPWSNDVYSCLAPGFGLSIAFR